MHFGVIIISWPYGNDLKVKKGIVRTMLIDLTISFCTKYRKCFSFHFHASVKISSPNPERRIYVGKCTNICKFCKINKFMNICVSAGLIPIHKHIIEFSIFIFHRFIAYDSIVHGFFTRNLVMKIWSGSQATYYSVKGVLAGRLFLMMMLCNVFESGGCS